MKYVCDQSGHSSIKMTADVYSHLMPGANRQAMNSLPSLNSPIAAQKAAGENAFGTIRKSASKDGKTMRQRRTGVTPDGKPIEETLLFDRH